MGLDLNLDELRECRFIKIRFGSLPIESYEKLASYDSNPYVVFFPGSVDKEHYWGMYCAPIDQIAEVDRIFSGLYFERTRLHELTGTMQTAMEHLKNQQAEIIKQKDEINRQIETLWNQEKQMIQTFIPGFRKNMFIIISAVTPQDMGIISFSQAGFLLTTKADSIPVGQIGID
jgi:V/A-type H+/Na+-transporting ATPase subunit I